MLTFNRFTDSSRSLSCSRYNIPCSFNIVTRLAARPDSVRVKIGEKNKNDLKPLQYFCIYNIFGFIFFRHQNMLVITASGSKSLKSIPICLKVCPSTLLIVTTNDVLTGNCILLKLKGKSVGIMGIRGISTVSLVKTTAPMTLLR